MFVATVIVSLLIALAATGSAIGKLTKQAQVVEALRTVGVPDSKVPVLAALELAGAAGVVIGLWVAPLGVAAALGLTLYFIGAVVAHLRVNDRHIQPPAALAVVAAIALVLRIVTM